MEAKNLKDNLKNLIEDVELTEDDRSYIIEEAKIAALLYHSLVSYGIPVDLAEDLTRDYFNSRLGCEEEEESGVIPFNPDGPFISKGWGYK